MNDFLYVLIGKISKNFWQIIAIVNTGLFFWIAISLSSISHCSFEVSTFTPLAVSIEGERDVFVSGGKFPIDVRVDR